MRKEQETRVFTDTGSSMGAEDVEVRELGVGVLPMDVKFFNEEDNQWHSYVDSELSPAEFYDWMRTGRKLPQTSGAIIGRAFEAYKKARKEGVKNIVSVHITAAHSVAWESALAGARMEAGNGLFIEVIDSQLVSLGTWFLTEIAARMAQEGRSLEEIKQEVLAAISKVETYATVANMRNLRMGGRVPALTGYLGDLMRVNPLLGMKDGHIVPLSKVRTFGRAKQEMIARVTNRDSNIVRLGILHANCPDEAEDVRGQLEKVFKGQIVVKEVGPAIGVHLGEGGLGIILMTE